MVPQTRESCYARRMDYMPMFITAALLIAGALPILYVREIFGFVRRRIRKHRDDIYRVLN